jgi:hypothetical protein
LYFIYTVFKAFICSLSFQASWYKCANFFIKRTVEFIRIATSVQSVLRLVGLIVKSANFVIWYHPRAIAARVWTERESNRLTARLSMGKKRKFQKINLIWINFTRFDLRIKFQSCSGLFFRHFN